MEAEKTAYEKLSLKQRRFVDALLGAANGVKASAARIAGYQNPAQEGYRLYRNPAVRAAIDELYAEHLMPASEALARLSEQARAGYADFIDASGNVNLQGLKDAGLMRLVKKISWDRNENLTVEFYDAQTALVQMGRHHGLFVEKHEHTGPGGGPLVIQEVVVEMPQVDDDAEDGSEAPTEPLES